MARCRPHGFGWIRDTPDFRDFPYNGSQAEALFDGLPVADVCGHLVDLREFFPAVDDQKGLNSSASHSCIAAIEYGAARACGTAADLSRLFVYKTARVCDGLTGNCGARIRTTLKAIRRFGVPAESAWRFEVANYDQEPTPPALYCYADDFRPLVYIRLDPFPSTGWQRLCAVRSFLSAGIPVIFGFAVPDSISAESIIPFRPQYDGLLGGQVVLAVGYDDDKPSLGATTPGDAAVKKGALLVRTSWGANWGDEGYGWLPYSLLTSGYAADFWVVTSRQWLESEEFGSKPAVLEIRGTSEPDESACTMKRRD